MAKKKYSFKKLMIQQDIYNQRLKKQRIQYFGGGDLNTYGALAQGAGQVMNLTQDQYQQQYGASTVGADIVSKAGPWGAVIGGIAKIGVGLGDKFNKYDQYGKIDTGSEVGSVISGAFDPFSAGMDAIKLRKSGDLSLGQTALAFTGLGGAAIGAAKNKQAAEGRNRAGIQESLIASQEANQIYQSGGDLNNITQYNGLTHGQGGLPLGNTGSEVEDGETRGIRNTQDYIFSDSLKPKDQKKKTFADVSKDIEKKYKGLDNDQFAIEAKDKELDLLRQEQEQLKTEQFQEGANKLQESNPEAFQQLIQSREQSLKKQFGGPLPPTERPKLLNQTEYNAAKKELEGTYNADITKRLGFAGISQENTSMEIYNQFMSEMKRENPIDYSGISLKPELIQSISPPTNIGGTGIQGIDISRIGSPGNLRTNNIQNENVNIPQNQILPQIPNAGTQISPRVIQPQVTKNLIGASGFDYSDKFYHSSSAAISKYKSLISQGKQGKADDLVLGYFDKSKRGAGRFSESTHSEGVKLGTTKPIRAKDLPDILSADAESKVKDLIPLLEQTGQFQWGGELNRIPQSGDISRGYQALGAYGQNQGINTSLLPGLSQLQQIPNQRFVPTDVNTGLTGTQYETNRQNVTDELGNIVTSEAMHNANRFRQNFIEPGNVSNYDPTQLGTTLQNTTNVNFNVDENASNPNFVKQISQNFTKTDMDAYRQFYKNLTGIDFQGSYDDIMNNVVNKSLNEVVPVNQGGTGQIAPIYRTGSNQLTLPSLITFLQQKGQNQDNQIIQNKRGDLVDPISSRGLESPPEQIDLVGATGVGQQNIREIPQINTKPFVGDYVTAGLSALPNIGAGIGSAILGKNLEYDRATAEQFDPSFVDPTRAIQEVRDQFAGTKDVIRQVSGGTGNLLSNLIGATAGESKAQAGIQSRYDQINVGIANQSGQFNAQQRQRINQLNANIALREQQDKTGLFQNAIGLGAQGLNIGVGNYIQSKRDAQMMNIAGGENYYYERVGSAGNQTPVRIVSAYGYETFDIPGEGVQYRDPITKETITEAQADKRRKIFNEDNSRKTTKKTDKKTNVTNPSEVLNTAFNFFTE